MDDLAKLKTLALLNEGRMDLGEISEVKDRIDIGDTVENRLRDSLSKDGRFTSLEVARKRVNGFGSKKEAELVDLASRGAFDRFLDDKQANGERFRSLAGVYRRIGLALTCKDAFGLRGRVERAAEEALTGSQLFQALDPLSNDFRQLSSDLELRGVGRGLPAIRPLTLVPPLEMVSAVLSGQNLEAYQQMLFRLQVMKEAAQDLEKASRSYALGPIETFKISKGDGKADLVALSESLAAHSSDQLIDYALLRLGYEFISLANSFEFLSPFFGFFAAGICPENECATPGISKCTAGDTFAVPASKGSIKPMTQVAETLGFASILQSAIDDTLEGLLNIGTELIPKDVKEVITLAFEGFTIENLYKIYSKGPGALAALRQALTRAFSRLAGSLVFRTFLSASSGAGALAPGAAAFYTILQLLQLLEGRLASQFFFICVEVKYTECESGYCYNSISLKRALVRVLPLDVGFGPGAGAFSGETQFLQFRLFVQQTNLLDVGKESLKSLQAALKKVTNSSLQADVQARIQLEMDVKRIKAENTKLAASLKSLKSGYDALLALAKGAAIKKLKAKEGNLSSGDLC